jgi:hypothetical protein
MALIVALAMVFPSFARAQTRQPAASNQTAPTFLFKLSTGGKVVYAASISKVGTVAMLGGGKMALTGLQLSPTVVAGLVRLTEAEGFFAMPRVLGKSNAPRTAAYEEIDVVTPQRTHDVRLVMSRNGAFCPLYSVLLAVVGTPGPHNDPTNLC